jgi:hypothetical protein
MQSCQFARVVGGFPLDSALAAARSFATRPIRVTVRVGCRHNHRLEANTRAVSLKSSGQAKAISHVRLSLPDSPINIIARISRTARQLPSIAHRCGGCPTPPYKRTILPRSNLAGRPAVSSGSSELRARMVSQEGRKARRPRLSAIAEFKDNGTISRMTAFRGNRLVPAPVMMHLLDRSIDDSHCRGTGGHHGELARNCGATPRQLRGRSPTWLAHRSVR